MLQEEFCYLRLTVRDCLKRTTRAVKEWKGCRDSSPRFKTLFRYGGFVESYKWWESWGSRDYEAGRGEDLNLPIAVDSTEAVPVAECASKTLRFHIT